MNLQVKDRRESHVSDTGVICNVLALKKYMRLSTYRKLLNVEFMDTAMLKMYENSQGRTVGSMAFKKHRQGEVICEILNNQLALKTLLSASTCLELKRAQVLENVNKVLEQD